MREIRIEKVTLNIGSGKDQTKLEKGITLLKNITGISPVKTFSKKRIPTWGIRPGLPIGCKITLRNEKATELLQKLLSAKDNRIKPSQIDQNGNISFGIPEYIDIPGVKYDPEIKIMGLEACITLRRNGFRIKRRRIKPQKIHKKHSITKKDAIDYMKNKFNVIINEDK
ncbi:MAG: 50S ribosomal protein L5 [Candidatus Woesearchaeota archaeon]